MRLAQACKEDESYSRRSASVAFFRYVDGTGGRSPHMCSACIVAMLFHVYATQVILEDSSEVVVVGRTHQNLFLKTGEVYI